MEAGPEFKFKTQIDLLKPPEPLPDGFYHPQQFLLTQKACKQLSDFYIQAFSKHPSFLKAHPVLLGSWAREELCPKSDLDLGFLGEEAEVKKFVSFVQSQGLKVRSRMLSKEVVQAWPLLEQLSLFEATPLTDFAALEIRSWIKGIDRKKCLKEMEKDRLQRMTVFSIENVLEPHLKTGAGGLRDLLHFSQTQKLFPEIEVEEHVREVMEYCRWFILTLRFKLHAIGGQDYLQADLQIELAKWFGFSDFRALMKQVQLCLSRSLFYSEWIQKWALVSAKKRKELETINLKKPEQLRSFLEKNSDILALYQIRKSMDVLITPSWIKSNSAAIEAWMNSIFSWKSSETVLRGYFRSRLADLIDPRLRLIVGYNQHDQYHAYTADAHILNLLIEFKSVVKKPSLAGGFKKMISELSEKDLTLLSWACYYHDLGKGSSGAHEDIGSDYVKKDSVRFGRKKEWSEEVDWMVRNHLEFSKAAFRGDPNDEATHRKLFALGLTPERIRRLMVFTFLDIRATHPKAWTPWKERLLLDLYKNLMDPERSQEIERAEALRKIYPDFNWTRGFLSQVPYVSLKKDLKKISSLQTAHLEFYSTPKLSKKGFFWVRYYNPENQKGILLRALQMLFALGCSVQQAFVFSLPFGVYDWFLVESPLELESLKKRARFVKAEGSPKKLKARWDEVSFLSVTDTGWTLLLKGKDARGLLMSTIEQLVELGAEVKSARAQTWGRQVEDVIEIQPLKEKPEDWLKTLKDSF